MKPTLTAEQRHALNQHPDGVEVEDTLTNRVYFLTDAELHRRAMLALKEQEDRKAIQSGIEDMQNGRVISFEEVDRRIRERLGLPQRQL